MVPIFLDFCLFLLALQCHMLMDEKSGLFYVLSRMLQLLSVRQEHSMICLVFLQGANVCEAIIICSSFPLRFLNSSDGSVVLKVNTQEPAVTQQACHSLYSKFRLYLRYKAGCW